LSTKVFYFSEILRSGNPDEVFFRLSLHAVRIENELNVRRRRI
jgi:hypothetical protein